MAPLMARRRNALKTLCKKRTQFNFEEETKEISLKHLAVTFHLIVYMTLAAYLYTRPTVELRFVELAVSLVTLQFQPENVCMLNDRLWLNIWINSKEWMNLLSLIKHKITFQN